MFSEGKTSEMWLNIQMWFLHLIQVPFSHWLAVVSKFLCISP